MLDSRNVLGTNPLSQEVLPGMFQQVSRAPLANTLLRNFHIDIHERSQTVVFFSEYLCLVFIWSITKEGGKRYSHQGWIRGYGVTSQTTCLLQICSSATVEPFRGGSSPSAPSLCARALSLSMLLLAGTARARQCWKSAISPSSPGSFYWEKALKTEHWALGASHYWGIIPFRAPSRPQSKETRVFVGSCHVHTHTHL